MTTSERKGSFTVIAPILVVYLVAFAAILDTSKGATPPQPAPTPTITIPANATITIEKATIQLNAKEEDKGGWLSSGTILTVLGGIAAAVIAGVYANRTANLQERRLKVETFNKFADLMKRREGDKIGPNEGAATVFSLVKLEEYDYALEMIRVLWPENGMTRTAAVWAINKIFERTGFVWWSGNSPQTERDALKEYAANTLWLNARRLRQQDGGVEWPSTFAWSWDQIDVPPYVHSCLLRAILALLVHNPRRTWAKSNMDAMIGRLNQARTSSKLGGEAVFRAARIELALLEWYHYERPAVQIGDRVKGAQMVAVDVLKTQCEDSLNHVVPRKLRKTGELSNTAKYSPDEYAHLLEDDFLEGIEILQSRGWNQMS